MRFPTIVPGFFLAFCALVLNPGRGHALEHVRIAEDGKGFVLQPSGKEFKPKGYNYDRDEAVRLIEDYWVDEWPTIERHFACMKALNANVVRVHLQFAKFMRTADSANEAALDQLGKLLALAERNGMYLDITGLGCYRKGDVPAWYDELDEARRWAAQAHFWEAVSERCKNSPAVFCYDLMNEPMVGGREKTTVWLGPALQGMSYVQYITRELGQRERWEAAKQWIDHLKAAIRKHDAGHLVTVGMVDWSLDRPGLSSGFVPSRLAPSLDFVCVHLYPEKGKVDEALEVLAAFAATGKPVVIEETFPLKCSQAEFNEFLERSKKYGAKGWIGFCWGILPEEFRKRPNATRLDIRIATALEQFSQWKP